MNALHRLIENTALWLVEAAFEAWPRRRPTLEQIARAVIVAHRGERDDRRVKENTIAAFDPVIAAGVGAIEFDVRYTADDEPVVIHDANLARVFGLTDRIDALRWATLRARVPELPHLAEIVERYAQRAHLMIELKTRGSALAETRLRDRLADLVPRDDYHVLSLDPRRFDAIANLPGNARVPVAKHNWQTVQNWSRCHDCGGLAGPYVFIRRTDIADSRRQQRLIGSGFINRRGLLLREIGRGISWIFTNRPLALQRMRDQALARASR